MKDKIVLDELTSVHVFSRVRIARILVFYILYHGSLLALFRFFIGLSVLRFTAFDYPFGIFKTCIIFFLTV
jgi:hypothetical protein